MDIGNNIGMEFHGTSFVSSFQDFLVGGRCVQTQNHKGIVAEKGDGFVIRHHAQSRRCATVIINININIIVIIVVVVAARV